MGMLLVAGAGFGTQCSHGGTRLPLTSGFNYSCDCPGEASCPVPLFLPESSILTLTRFVTKDALRNKRRSPLTVLSIGFSLLLLPLMMAIWRNFYLKEGSEVSALRLVTRHKVSLTFSMPGYYREKIRALPGVAVVVPQNWFGGVYKDAKSRNFFAQFGTDPEEFFKVYKDWEIPEDQIVAWQRDRAGAVVDSKKAEEFGWKVGQKVIITGTIFPTNLELTIRGIFKAPHPTQAR